uniref:PAS/PAC/GGDEF-domain containing protein n=1 Tax=uncultured bacterium A1Q1_fos_499 TaxID=1256578 RepID=L7VYF8_9BACT|nr:PAS/PAC/GGDEF-domain containing protein [uncultured bacterium A1Q1_fos_499]
MELDSAALAGALFDAYTDAIVVVDATGRIVTANPACQQMLGYPPAALIGQPVELLVPERFPGHSVLRSGYVAHATPRAMGAGLALSARHADGSEIPVEISLTPIAFGQERLAAAALRDLRGRTPEPDALRIQATALRSAANGIVITDRTGTIVWVNPAACAITGYAAEELVGRHTRLLKSGAHGTDFYSELWRQVTRGETWSGTIVNRRKDGAIYYEEQTIAPVLDAGGEVTHFVAIKSDVSARHRAEEALAAAHRDLAARVAEIESLNRQLREQAIRDPLTGLHNRRYFDEVARHDAARARRTGEALALIALDIDAFKEINDQYGHAAGDLVLEVLAEILTSSVRGSDLVCRTGGDEFSILLPGASPGVALERAELIRESFAATPIGLADGEVLRATVSAGLAFLQAGGEGLPATLRRADLALYAAKRAGRNRVCCDEESGPPA